MLKQTITWAAVFAFAVYALTDRHGVANFVHGLLGALATADHVLASFANSL